LHNIDLRLRRTHLVEFAGLLVGTPSREPLTGCEVQLIGSVPGTQDPLWRKHPAAADGTFRFSLLEPGSYKLAVFRAGLSPLPYIVPIELPKTGAEEMRIPVPPFNRLEGRLQLRDAKLAFQGTPRIGLRTRNNATDSCDIDPDGTFKCANVPPGEYFLEVGPNLRLLGDRTRRFSVKEIRFGEQNGLHRPVTVAENGNPAIEILLSDEPAGIAGKVVDEASKMAFYQVIVSRFSAHTTVSATVGPPDFQIPELAPGEYEITAYRMGARGTMVGAACPETTRVTVVEGSVKYITLRPCATQ